jgi:hypothetical protein
LLDDYVAMASLQGDSYAIDSVQVHTFLVYLVSENDTAEAKIQGLQRPNDGRYAFKKKNLLQDGKRKPPHMWWSEFEKKLTQAFKAHVKREGQIVNSDSMKIRMPIAKIKADF